MLNDRLNARLNFHFDILDVDKNNAIDRQDFVLRAQRIATARHMEKGSAKAQRILDHHEFNWQNLHQALGKSSTDSISRKEWLAIFEYLLNDRASFVAGMNVFADVFFKALDLDDNGHISESEHLAYLHAVNADTRGVAESFRTIDSDGDGHVSRADVLKVMLDFYLTDDPAPAVFLLGAHPPVGA